MSTEPIGISAAIIATEKRLQRMHGYLSALRSYAVADPAPNHPQAYLDQATNLVRKLHEAIDEIDAEIVTLVARLPPSLRG
jgi:hypothetical protein